MLSAEQIEAAAKFAGYAFEVPWFLGSFLTYGLGAGLLSLHALRAKVGPKWVGIVGGISGIIWLREFLPFLLPLTTIGSLINIVTISIWCIGLSTSLVRKVATN